MHRLSACRTIAELPQCCRVSLGERYRLEIALETLQPRFGAPAAHSILKSLIKLAKGGTVMQDFAAEKRDPNRGVHAPA